MEHPTIPDAIAPVRFAERAAPRPIGDTGIARWNGQIVDDTAARLWGARWHRVVREMLASSPVIRGMLFAVEMLIRRAEWHLDPAPDGGLEADEIAGFVESCRRDMRTPWEDTLAAILSFLPYGYSVHEIVYKRRLGPDRDPASEADDGRIGWDEWAPRAQETLLRWEFDDAGHAVAFIQQSPNRPAPVAIPLARCLHFRAGGYRGSPEGESVLRAAYTDWDAIRKLQTIEAIGIERDLAGLPIAGVPPEYLSGNRTPEQTAFYQALQKIVTGVRQNEHAGVIFPLDYDDRGNRRFTFDLISAGGARQFDTGAVINRRTTQMTMAMLADFLTVGHGATGSYALSRDKTRLFTTAIAAWLDGIANTINSQAIRPLLRVNGIDPRLTPVLRPGTLDDTDLKATAAFVQALLPLISTLNREDQLALIAHLFDLADLPAITTEPEQEDEPRDDAPAGDRTRDDDDEPPPDDSARPTPDEAATESRDG